MSRTYGRLWLEDGQWKMTCDPHVAVMVKRIFQKIPTEASGVYSISNTPPMARDLEWFCQRYPLRVENPVELARLSRQHRDEILTLDQLLGPHYIPKAFPLQLPAREYQNRAAELLLLRKSLLLADDVGLGKTCTSICTLADPNTLPAIVVCPVHIQQQWKDEIKRFMPELRVHIIKQQSNYALPVKNGRTPDVLIITYHKLPHWQEALREYARLVIFDEVQELRRRDSQKYAAARNISGRMVYRMGLSATPIYNYGGEIFNIFDILAPDALGTADEFYREWCDGWGEDASLKDPAAFGAWLQDNHLMLRRTRAQVGRELPPLSRITESIECNRAKLDEVAGKAGELARIILGEDDDYSGIEMMQAESEFNVMLRQATGIAKAPHVANYVEMLVENGEPVVLFGWHRAVYEIWMELLRKYNPVMYTGSESPRQKQEAVRRFVAGESKVFIISLRSGAGLDGLQGHCRTIVKGELDWSSSVHEQCIGRVYRDGQKDPVQVVFLVSEMGSDPFVSEILGIKRAQSDGLLGRSALQQTDSKAGLKNMARHYLEKLGHVRR